MNTISRNLLWGLALIFPSLYLVHPFYEDGIDNGQVLSAPSKIVARLLEESERDGFNLLTDEDRHVLSVGISTNGNAEIKMASMHSLRQVVATTIDTKGLEATQAEIGKAEQSGEIKPGQMVILYQNVKERMPPPYGEGYFDFIYARLVLHYLTYQELQIALKELYRLLKEGRKMYVVVRSVEDWELKPPDKGSKIQWPEGAVVSYDTKTRMTTYPATYGPFKGKQSTRQFFTPETLKEVLESAGFKVISIEPFFERIYGDYERKDPNPNLAALIKAVVEKPVSHDILDIEESL